MKVRKLFPLLLVIITVLGLSGCTKSSSVEIGSLENNTNARTSMSYTLFTGTKTREITVEKDKPIDVAVDIETKSGSLDLSITNEAGEYSYEGHDLETNSFVVTLSDAGNYTVQIITKKHKGGFTITWE
ncbi:MAG TPA: hypothetical protein GXX75_08720 [Clostridiales bacterium]|nr:hypothetical protein [Clostridiales bacterium]